MVFHVEPKPAALPALKHDRATRSSLQEGNFFVVVWRVCWDPHNLFPFYTEGKINLIHRENLDRSVILYVTQNLLTNSEEEISYFINPAC